MLPQLFPILQISGFKKHQPHGSQHDLPWQVLEIRKGSITTWADSSSDDKPGLVIHKMAKPIQPEVLAARVAATKASGLLSYLPIVIEEDEQAR